MSDTALPPTEPPEYPVVCFRCGLAYEARPAKLEDSFEDVQTNEGQTDRVIRKDHDGIDACLEQLQTEAVSMKAHGKELFEELRVSKINYDLIVANIRRLSAEKEAH